MPAFSLKNRNKSILERKFIDKVLQEEGENIIVEQQRRDAKYEFSPRLNSKRKFSVNNNELELEHHLVQRFVDMNNVRGFKKKRKTPIHNSVIFGHYNNIQRSLRFGFTVDIQKSLENELKIVING